MWDLCRHPGPHAQKGLTLGLMIYCCHIAMLHIWSMNKEPPFSFCTEPCKFCCPSLCQAQCWAEGDSSKSAQHSGPMVTLAFRPRGDKAGTLNTFWGQEGRQCLSISSLREGCAAGHSSARARQSRACRRVKEEGPGAGIVEGGEQTWGLQCAPLAISAWAKR